MDELDEHARRQQQDIAAIKERERFVRVRIERGERSVETQGMTLQQMGLRWVVADLQGRLWRDDGDRLTLIFRPQESDEVYDGK
jgi:hypothetical protein